MAPPRWSGFAPLLAAVQAGDADAATELFRRMHPRLRRFMMAAEPRVADDLAAEVWEAVAKGVGSFVGDEDDFRAWLFTIARRRVVEHRRRGARRRTDPVASSTFDRLVATDAPESETVAKLSAEDAIAIITALLPEDHADVVLLRVLGDLDVAQVAGIVGRSENWVRVTQHRALRKLADRMSAKSGVTR